MHIYPFGIAKMRSVFWSLMTIQAYSLPCYTEIESVSEIHFLPSIERFFPLPWISLMPIQTPEPEIVKTF
jgi:hypothetical protein